MNNQHTYIGIILGFLANAIGIVIAALILGQSIDAVETLKIAAKQGLFVKLISVGALLNLITFFYFIRKRSDNKAKGVLIATVIMALISVILKFAS